MRPENVLLLGVDPKLHNYSPDKTRLFLSQLRERVSGLPGVRSASFSGQCAVKHRGHHV
jgi:hypothetical protein